MGNESVGPAGLRGPCRVAQGFPGSRSLHASPLAGGQDSALSGAWRWKGLVQGSGSGGDCPGAHLETSLVPCALATFCNLSEPQLSRLLEGDGRVRVRV